MFTKITEVENLLRFIFDYLLSIFACDWSFDLEDVSQIVLYSLLLVYKFVTLYCFSLNKAWLNIRFR